MGGWNVRMNQLARLNTAARSLCTQRACVASHCIIRNTDTSIKEWSAACISKRDDIKYPNNAYPCKLITDALWRMNVIVHIVKLISGAALILLAENLISLGSVCSHVVKFDSNRCTCLLTFFHFFEFLPFRRVWNLLEARDILAEI